MVSTFCVRPPPANDICVILWWGIFCGFVAFSSHLGKRVRDTTPEGVFGMSHEIFCSNIAFFQKCRMMGLFLLVKELFYGAGTD